MERMKPDVFIKSISKEKGSETYYSSFIKDDTITIEKIQVQEPLLISGYDNFPLDISIHNCFFHEVVFENCTFEKKLSFLNCEFKKITFKENNKFNSLLKFEGSGQSRMNRTIFFGNGDYKNLKLESLTNERSPIEINIHGGEYKSLFILKFIH